VKKTGASTYVWLAQLVEVVGKSYGTERPECQMLKNLVMGIYFFLTDFENTT